MHEEQRRFDQFQFQQQRRATSVADQIHARIKRGGERHCGQCPASHDQLIRARRAR
jgi:hypothetical protein